MGHHALNHGGAGKSEFVNGPAIGVPERTFRGIAFLAYRRSRVTHLKHIAVREKLTGNIAPRLAEQLRFLGFRKRDAGVNDPGPERPVNGVLAPRFYKDTYPGSAFACVSFPV